MVAKITERKLIDVFKKHLGDKIIPRGNVINRAFPHTFNASLAEEPFLRKYDKLIGFSDSWDYGIIQPCIRPSDFDSIIKKTCNNSTRYPILFMGESTPRLLQNNLSVIKLTIQKKYENSEY